MAVVAWGSTTGTSPKTLTKCKFTKKLSKCRTRHMQVEVLVEMAARNQERKGTASLYTPLTLLEALK